MTSDRITVHRIIARTAAIATTSLAAIALAGPASAQPEVYTQFLDVPDCKSTGQVCGVVPKVFVTAVEAVSAMYIAGGGCSDAIAHIIIGGREVGASRVAPYQSTPLYSARFDSPGRRSVAVQLEGLPGGCNSGTLSAWQGTVRVEYT